MKPFLSIDITENKKNNIVNGEKEFIVQKPSEMLSAALDASADSATEIIKKSKLPAPIRAVQFISGLFFGIAVLGLIDAYDGEPIAEFLKTSYKNASWIILGGIICLVIWAVLKFFSIKKQKQVLETEETESVMTKVDSAANNIYAELGVPAGARDTDVLSFFYKIKDGTPKAVTKGFMPAPYLNVEYKIFSDGENLCLANTEAKFAVPLSSLRRIHTVKKHVSVTAWNKDEPYNKGEYKQYKLYESDDSCIHFRWYHILEFERDGEAWGIYFPSYELPAFEAVTHLRAE